ncbi:hypothetical protein G6N74_28425 [Mesorhizobium sp. CGMCC 1.15528]|uniref:Gene transfer agent family protein n=1 Tax=Mesorhizobium zhangyense TaxID=1776730 RepID=A0A7C9VFM6_9HYPH|nr:hypothetical protein [Mesorhizobium zhangyense]NGN44987.1 hypothetical protein [Mesorhizobium zhangyense]
MAHEVNGARGEVALKIGDIDLVIAATMRGLASLSTELGCKTFGELFERLSGVEAATLLAAIPRLTIRGDAEAAVDKLELSDVAACAAAINEALAHHLRKTPKKA